MLARMKSSLAFAVALTGLSMSCAAPQPAPEALDDIARFFWNRFAPADEDAAVSDVELAEAAANVHKAIDGDALTEQKGTLQKITETEIETVGLDVDTFRPTRATGMFTASIVHCSLDQMKDIIVEPDQLSLYPEAYETYSRDFDDVTDERIQTWTVHYRAAPEVPNQYDATVKSGIRDVPADALSEGGVGRVLVRRGFLPEAATFDDGVDAEFTHDFQIETYHERAPGEIVHFYGIWRYMRFGIIDSSSGLMMDTTLNGMIDWDHKTDELCAQ